jgi:hypothetical protein
MTNESNLTRLSPFPSGIQEYRGDMTNESNLTRLSPFPSGIQEYRGDMTNESNLTRLSPFPSGIQEYRGDMTNEELLRDPVREQIEEIMSGFYTARIGLRFLVEHHIVSSTERQALNRKTRRILLSADRQAFAFPVRRDHSPGY